MRTVLLLMLTTCVVTCALPLAAKKKPKEENTQILELPPEPPAAIVAQTRRLIFRTTPLSSKGLLSQQTREALRNLVKASGDAHIVKLRAFVVGAGDLRRIPQIVSEVFTEKHQDLPAVTVIQGGALPLEGAQVVIESIAVARRDVTDQTLVLVSTQEFSADQPLQPLAALATRSLEGVREKLHGAEAARVTCFVTLLDGASKINALMASYFPHAALNLVQTQRAANRSSVACEASGWGTGGITADRVVITGSQVSFGFQEEDARRPLARMEKELQQRGSALKDAAVLNFFPLSASIAAQVRRAIAEAVPGKQLPALSVVPFEAVPGMDASFAFEVLAPVTRPSVINQ